MKGIRKFKIDGKDTELRLDMNALCDFTDEHDIDLSKWDQHLNDPRKIRSLIYCMAKQGDNDHEIDERFIGKLTFSQMQNVMGMINESAPDSENLPEGKGKGNG